MISRISIFVTGFVLKMYLFCSYPFGWLKPTHKAHHNDTFQLKPPQPEIKTTRIKNPAPVRNIRKRVAVLETTPEV